MGEKPEIGIEPGNCDPASRPISVHMGALIVNTSHRCRRKASSRSALAALHSPSG
jgi:hypothetical protein